MDDEIDIDEHDILEHPQVKAAFPDLSKIQIHLHASGGSFLDEMPENLLEERPNYTDNEDNVSDDLSKTAQEYENEEENFEEETGLEAFERTDGEETYEISDSEIDVARQVAVFDSQLNVEGINQISEHEGNDVQVISEDENDDTQDAADDETEVMAVDPEDIEERNVLVPELIDNVQQITDGEDIGLAEDDVAFIEDASQTVRLFEDLTDNINGLIEEVPETNNESLDVPVNHNGPTLLNPESNDGFVEEVPETDVIGEYHDNKDGFFEEAPVFNDDAQEYEEESTDRDMNADEETESKDYQQISIKEEIEYEPENSTDFDELLPKETFNDDELPPEDIYHYKNKIILGSKPSPVQGNLSNINKGSYLVVVLDDWNVHLSRSQSYCEDCKTLFTTPNALDSHRMTAHSLLAPITTNRAVKSTALSSVNVARKSTANKNNSLGSDLCNSTYCNHCNVSFDDHTTLIKHLYELLPVKQCNKHTCHICDATFQTQNDLVKHNSIHVKIETPRKYLKAKKSDNPILRKMLSVKSDDSALKRYSAEHNKRNSEVKGAVEVKNEVNQCKYKCLVCSDVFESYSLARGHRLAHPKIPLKEMLKRLLIKRVHPHNSKHKLTYEDDKSNKIGNKVGKVKRQRSDKPFPLIPTSALFQCSKCNIHFTSSVAGQSHITANNCGDKRIWSCPTCKKKLRKRDQNCYKRQHELSNKIKIYKITRNTYERALCKCPDCSVYFEYIPLRKHLTKCGKIPTAKCKICNILFPIYKLEEHVKKHEVMKLKKKDFILVEYAVRNNKSNAVRKASKSKVNTLSAKKAKLESKITIKTEPGTAQVTPKIVNKLKFEREKYKLYFCRHCKSFLSRRNFHRSNKIHLSKQCAKVGPGKRYTSNCNLCGLQVFGKTKLSHDRLHTRKKLTLNNFEFYDFATLKPITPPIPQYPSCDKCQIHFLNRSMIRNHICGEDYENCNVCGEKFENSALAVHLPIHRMFSAASKPTPTSPKIIPELMMKYESLNAIWNILFICGKCELVTDLYNKAVEHSQAHLNKDPQPSTIKCYICNLKFDESCWSKHSELHSRMSLSNKAFKILKYTPQNLLDESWFQMFETLPEKEIRQIIDRSVFGSERSLKMKLVKDGLPEFTVYCCSRCHVSYDSNDILSHVNTKCKDSKHICKDCGVAFNSAATLQFHDLLHKKGIKNEEFRIVHFLKSSAKQASNSKDKAEASNRIAGSKVKSKVTEKNAQFLLYKCTACTLCIVTQQNRSYHVCAPDHHSVYCKICKQNFSFRQMGVHRAKHKREHAFRAKNIKIIHFEPTPEGKDKPKYHNPKYKNRSKRNKPAKRNLVDTGTDNRDSDSQDDSDIEPESSNSTGFSVNSDESSGNKTSKNLTTPKGRTTLNSSKLNTRRGSIENETDETGDKKIAKLYKCDCGLHYTSLKSIEKHVGACDSSDEISKENCSKCGLLFPTDVLVSHLCKHHSRNTKIIVEIVHKKSKSQVAEVSSTQKMPNTSTDDGIKLYKCSACNVYFMNQNSCYKHTLKHVLLDPKEYIECKMCGFQFKILSLHIHMRKHHQRTFNMEKVLVEEYQPSAGKQAPTIDIYFANDRFQNVQVSSSND